MRITLARSIVLAIIWLLSGVIGVVAGIGYFVDDSPDRDHWLLASIAVGGLILSGLCARAAFEIHRWRLSRRHFDWLSSE